MNRILALAIVALSLTVAGCTSKTTGDAGNAATHTGTTDAGVAANSTVAAASNKTSELTCSALAGGSGSSDAGVGGQYVGGCPFGAPTTTATLLLKVDLPSGCSPYQTPPGSGQVSTSAQAAKEGDSYPAGTQYEMFCDATAVMPAGTITLVG